MAKILLQKNLINQDNLKEIKGALDKNGIEYLECDVIPFEDVGDFLIRNLKYSVFDFQQMIPYGSTKMMKHFIEMQGLGLYYDEEAFKPSTWIERRPDMMNVDVTVLTMRDAREFMLDSPGTYFVRPNDDLKPFAGEVIESNVFVEWIDHISCGGFTIDVNEQIVAISPTQNIIREFRCFIVNRKVIDISQYRLNGQLAKKHIPNDRFGEDGLIVEAIRNMATKWLPHHNIVMDVALVKDDFGFYHDLKVVEFNCINCSGVYDNNIEAVFTALAKSNN
jgi:hypothetical protein